MANGIARNVNKKLTTEDQARHQKIREQIAGEKPELMARGGRPASRHRERESVAA